MPQIIKITFICLTVLACPVSKNIQTKGVYMENDTGNSTDAICEFFRTCKSK